MSNPPVTTGTWCGSWTLTGSMAANSLRPSPPANCAALKEVPNHAFTTGKHIQGWADYSKANEDGGHHEYEHMFAMVIDLDLCTGCNACSTACYAENNLAVVGEDKFGARQAMHWMRVERYFDEPDLGAPEPDTQSRGASFCR